MASMLHRFRGCMLGALLGDCLGQPFEFESVVGKMHLQNYFTQLLDPSRRMPYKPYTDDTAMAKSVALSLVKCKGYNAEDMALSFTKEYFKEPKRGYGAAVHDVFMGLRNSNCEDPYRPAQRQFHGMGSYGNGAAMRVHPVALMYCNDEDKAVEVAELQSKITHHHRLAYQGAILQTLAVGLALHSDSGAVDANKFLDVLISKMETVENKEPGDTMPISNNPGEDPDSPRNTMSYAKRLGTVKKFVALSEPPPLEEIHDLLGVQVSALMSVPTAVYCFLASQRPLPGIQCDNKLQRCIQFAISLGGDTDTIASMAGAIAGAHLGDASIPSQLLKRVEAVDDVISWADKLHEIVASSLSKTQNTVSA